MKRNCIPSGHPVSPFGGSNCIPSGHPVSPFGGSNCIPSGHSVSPARIAKNILLALGLALLLNGCAPEQNQITYISVDEAKQLALDSCGMTTDGVDSISTDLKARNGLEYYRVTFTAAGLDYRYDIDALTGAVIESQSSASETGDGLAADINGSTDAGGQQAQETPQTQAIPSVQTIPQAQAVSPDQPSSQQPSSAAADGGITAEEARSKALTHAGLTADQVTFVKDELDYEDGRLVYEIEFYGGDYTEYDYEIDASTGEIVSFDYDAEYYTAAPSAGTGSEITAEKAKELALAQVPGASAGDIREFKIDYDDGRLEYEGKIIYNGMEYEFEIDGYSGAFRDWEAEPVGH